MYVEWPRRGGHVVRTLAYKSGGGELKSAVGSELLTIDLIVQSSKPLIN
jgi:hypothetical protein